MNIKITCTDPASFMQSFTRLLYTIY